VDHRRGLGVGGPDVRARDRQPDRSFPLQVVAPLSFVALMLVLSIRMLHAIRG
jgi:hypothetical protein